MTTANIIDFMIENNNLKKEVKRLSDEVAQQNGVITHNRQELGKKEAENQQLAEENKRMDDELAELRRTGSAASSADWYRAYKERQDLQIENNDLRGLIDAQAKAMRRLEDRAYRLGYAICGGEDADGLIESMDTEAFEELIAKERQNRDAFEDSLRDQREYAQRDYEGVVAAVRAAMEAVFPAVKTQPFFGTNEADWTCKICDGGPGNYSDCRCPTEWKYPL